LLVSFPHGRGHVIYTSFHNHAQVSDIERRLLEFLVFRPILASAAAAAADVATARNFTPEKEIYAALNSKAQAGRFPVQVPQPTTLMCLLSWEGQASFRLELNNPQGTVVKEVSGPRSPIGIEVYAPLTGEWAVTITPLQVPFAKFPFV